MKGMTMKVLKRVVLAVLVLGVLFVVGDYFGLFISYHADGAILIPFGFKFIDSSDDSVVIGVEVTAEYEGNPFNARTLEKSGKVQYVMHRGCGGVQRILFDPYRGCKRKYNKQEIDFTFKHPSYETVKKTISRGRDGASFNVELVPLKNAKVE